MQNVERAVERLTEHHTEWTEAGAVEWPPLLLWLEQSVTEVVGRSGGSGGVGVPLNTDALELLDHIRGRYRLMCAAVFVDPAQNLVAGLARLWEVVKADRAGGRIDDEQWERITAEIQGWVHRIEAEDDRPRKFELTVPCPRCETRWVLDKDGLRTAAVRIEFIPDGAPTAECRNRECAAIWAGWEAMAELGLIVGANQDREMLTAFGIDLRRMLAT